MKAFEIQAWGSVENLKLTSRPAPTPGPGQILLRIRAASINFRDHLMLLGSYNPKQRLPLIPLGDGAGEVTEVGAGVTRFKPGDRVAGLFNQRWMGGPPTRERLRTTLGGPLDGMLAEYAVLPEEGAVFIPEHLSFEEAAALPIAGVTAWRALVSYGSLKAGDIVLVQGTGGVSVFALQFAKAHGARVIVTSSSDEKLERARALGADHTINYRTKPDWERLAWDYSGGTGVDNVIEVGGAGTFEKSLKCVRSGGQVSVIGVLSGVATNLNVLPVLMTSIRVQGITVGSRDDFEAMNRAISQGRLRPVLDKTYSFEEAREAYKCLASGQHFGKIAIRVN
ncbi:MAG: NAD(P)-dependent alcohol dehydrogenase [Bdellovibrionota bacterium]